MAALALIVSSDPEMTHRLRRLVEVEGAETILAPNAHEAMRLFRLREPDLSLLDVRDSIPGGAALCSAMKTLHTGSRLVVVVVGPADARLEAFAAGCDAFVVEQPDPRRLVTTIRRFLGVIRRPARRGSAIALSP